MQVAILGPLEVHTPLARVLPAGGCALLARDRRDSGGDVLLACPGMVYRRDASDF